MLFEASKIEFCRAKNTHFDMLYHSFCHYRVLRLKLENKIVRQSFQMSMLFDEYEKNLEQLQLKMLPSDEHLEDAGESIEGVDREKLLHLRTEIAFSYLEHVKAAEKLLKQSNDFVKEQERYEHLDSLLKLIHEAIQRLTKAEFYFEAINLN